MADLKISQLPSATTPLAGTEVLPIVQSSTTKQVSIANLTAGRSVSVADATLTTGNLVIGTSGKGIDFSATGQAGGMTSELLNDYEEGTWTPEFTTTGGDFSSITYSTQIGKYTKIGRVVYIYIQIVSLTQTGGSGSLRIKGLPFSANSADATIPVTFAFGWASTPAVVGGTLTSSTQLSLYNTLTNSECAFTSIQALSASYLRMSGVYETE